MNVSKTLKTAMLNRDIDGAKQLQEYANEPSLSYHKITRMLRGDKTVKLSDFEMLIEKLGYKLTVTL